MRLEKEFPVGITQQPVTFNQDIKAALPKNGIDPLYLAYALKGQESRAMSWANKTTHGTLRLTTPQLKEIPVPVPPPDEQLRIAEILGTWDKAIEEVNALVGKKKEQLHGLRQRLLAGRVRFPEFDDSWTEATLGEYFQYFSDRNSKGEDLPGLTCSKVHGVIPQSEKFDRRVASKDTSNYKVVERGNLVYDPMLLWDGSIGFVDCVDQGVVSPAYYTFQFNEQDGDRDFFRHLLATHRVKYQYEAISQGTNTRRQKAPRDAFLGIEVEVPSLREQQKIAEVMRAAETEIQKLKEKREALKRQKKGLMQRLLTGAVRTV
jgi:type I restriction enzyme S subunit